MGENWVAPDTPRRRLKAINALLASIFFDLIAFHKMKKYFFFKKKNKSSVECF